MRIATWNINSLKVRLARVEEWVAEIQPDVLCLQETKLADGAFPTLAFESLGYQSVSNGGDGRWNGVAILSRVGLDDVETSFDPGAQGSGPVDDYVASVLAESRLVIGVCPRQNPLPAAAGTEVDVGVEHAEAGRFEPLGQGPDLRVGPGRRDQIGADKDRKARIGGQLANQRRRRVVGYCLRNHRRRWPAPPAPVGCRHRPRTCR